MHKACIRVAGLVYRFFRCAENANCVDIIIIHIRKIFILWD